MPLPNDFQFSQNNLQDFEDCPRRFELRHLLRLEWPAPQSEPIKEQEHRIELGQRFHALIHQAILGISETTLTDQLEDPELVHWWQSFLQFSPLGKLPTIRKPEYMLSVPFAGFRLAAKYDLLAIDPGQRVVIMDWKTSTHKPNRVSILKRLQTKVYMLLLCLTGSPANNGKPFLPEQVEMVYWFADFPGEAEHISYSQEQYAKDLSLITGLIDQIKALTAHRETFSTREYRFDQSPFLLTVNERQCNFCNFRSLCNRGKQAGNWQESGIDAEELNGSTISLNFEESGEIEF